MFDRYLAAQPERGLRAALQAKKQLVLWLSFIGHGLAITVAVIWSYVYVEEVAPPALTVTFFSAAPPPPPPPPPPAGKKKENKPKTKRPLEQPKDIQPLVQPTEPLPEAEEEEEGEEGGQEGGVEGGEEGGVIGGVVGGVVGGQLGEEPPAEEPSKKVPPHVLEASLVYRAPVVTPVEVRNRYRGQQMRFTILVCIKRDGSVDRSKSKIIAGEPEARAAIMESVYQWKYKPQPVPLCAPFNLVNTITD
jgi:protein TonB